MRPEPSLEQLIESVPTCSVTYAIEWLRSVVRDDVRPFNGVRWIAPEGVFLSAEDVVRRYRLRRAQRNRQTVQGVG